MLVKLTIENIAIIDKSEIRFGRGLNVLTGETGAGKSIILDSIGAVLGGRSSKELVRTGRSKAFVEAVFDLGFNFKDRYEKIYSWFNENGVDSPENTQDDGLIIISREISSGGRSYCRVNGRAVTVSQLKKLGDILLDIHGQHENQSLLKNENHINYLDDYAGEETKKLLAEYRKLLAEYREVTGKIKNIEENALQRARELDILKFEINEISSAKLKKGEDKELADLKDYYSNLSKIKDVLNSSHNILKGDENGMSVVSVLANCSSEFSQLKRFGKFFDELSTRLEETLFELEDIAESIRYKNEETDIEPGMLERVDDRLHLINGLKRKYGRTIDEIQEYHDNALEKVGILSRSEEYLGELQEAHRNLKSKLYILAGDIDRLRREAATRLENGITEQLADLEMKGTAFSVNVSADERQLGDNGINSVEFLISTNLGEPLKPLSKIASGGELSRIMLAIKTVLAEADSTPTLVFDEIDMGISGVAATKVSEKLRIVSSNHQVICVTHLAQIAVKADNHYIVEKKNKNGRIITDVRLLNDDAQIAEIARLIDGGNMSEITIEHAKEMVSKAKCNRI